MVLRSGRPRQPFAKQRIDSLIVSMCVFSSRFSRLSISISNDASFYFVVYRTAAIEQSFVKKETFAYGGWTHCLLLSKTASAMLLLCGSFFTRRTNYWKTVSKVSPHPSIGINEKRPNNLKNANSSNCPHLFKVWLMDTFWKVWSHCTHALH